jgi:hypothetical protein
MRTLQLPLATDVRPPLDDPSTLLPEPERAQAVARALETARAGAAGGVRGPVSESSCALTEAGIERVVAGALPGDGDEAVARRKEAKALLASVARVPGVGKVPCVPLDAVLRAVAEAALPMPEEVVRVRQYVAATSQALRLRQLFHQCDVDRNGVFTLRTFEAVVQAFAPATSREVIFRAYREMSAHCGADNVIQPSIFVRVCLAHALRVPELTGAAAYTSASAAAHEPAASARARGAEAEDGPQRSTAVPLTEEPSRDGTDGERAAADGGADSAHHARTALSSGEDERAAADAPEAAIAAVEQPPLAVSDLLSPAHGLRAVGMAAMSPRSATTTKPP